MRLFLKPNDTFFFRDGRPFTQGQQSEGYSIETPLPSTVMGAFRTAYIAFCGDMTQFANGEMKSFIGTQTRTYRCLNTGQGCVLRGG